MYALKNRVQLIGNLGNAPEVKTIEGGKKLARFSMATSDSYKNAQGEKVTETQWHNIIAWGKIADIAEKFLARGTEVAVEGKLTNRSYTDKQGVKNILQKYKFPNFYCWAKKSRLQKFNHITPGAIRGYYSFGVLKRHLAFHVCCRFFSV